MTDSDGSGGAGDQSWRTSLLRQNVRNKIEEAIRQSGNPTSKTVVEMEGHIFQKARAKEEYLSFVARLILHVKEMNSKKQQPLSQQQQQQQRQQQPQQSLQQQTRQQTIQQMVGQNDPMVGNAQQSDPMSALQNMAGPQSINDMSNGNPMQLQMNTIGNDQMMNTNVASPMMNNMPNMSHPINNMMPNTNQLQQNRLSNPTAISGARMMSQRVLSPNIHSQIQQVRARHPNINQMPVPNQTESKYFEGHPMANSPSQGPPFKSGVNGGQQFVQNQNQPQNNMNHMNPPTPQMMPSPSGYAPSPSPINQSPHGGPHMRPVSSMSAASPQSISLNTPANIMIASPGNAGAGGRANEEQIYLEKLKNLQKYVEPLRKMIARIGQDESNRKKELDKTKNLLSILTDPSRRCPMTTLEKCEQFLEKMDFKIKTETTVAPIAVQQSHPPKLQDVCQPLLDAIAANIKKPLFNHTLQRTFGSAVAALTNNPYKHMSLPSLKRKYEEDCDVSEVLQGEIARLDSRFKVQLDPLQHLGSKVIHLICKLDDKDLPCVPPIAIRVPDSYPDRPPQCSTDILEYSASTFFQDIQKKFDLNINRLPQSYSVTTLLNSWELSVRQAVSSALDPICVN
ncbi:mediator of RNA polymerase II transcription subunit 15-like [Oppia nitens]|uniref:mediator of RNA polymerase II transcription subunit 15-like n=1 Tax=Oppia nitens TaxID=1686743 RepID=UPI0023DCD7E9|nr:mediator of RNA polymerase II transcription subunit 15-like [Oppia nitens]